MCIYIFFCFPVIIVWFYRAFGLTALVSRSLGCVASSNRKTKQNAERGANNVYQYMSK